MVSLLQAVDMVKNDRQNITVARVFIFINKT
jgi:hypothetical protein